MSWFYYRWSLLFQQKLCITCISSSSVRIQIQSNILPRRYVLVPLNATVVEHNVDFEVNFNPDVNVNSPNQAPSNDTTFNNFICNISSQSTVRKASNYVQSSVSVLLNTLAGVAVDGVNILNVNSLNQVDPFYPSAGLSAEGVDQYLSHPAGNGGCRYHIVSGCIVNPRQGNLTGCSPNIGCTNNVANYSLSTFSSYKTLTIIGIAKDGHVIYGPYLSAGV